MTPRPAIPAGPQRAPRAALGWALALAVPALGLVLAPPALAAPAGYSLDLAAGDGTSGAPVPGDALLSPLGAPTGVAVDASGAVYVADAAQHVILRIDAAGALAVVAGTGAPGAPLAGKATASPLSSPSGVALDAAGNLYIADTGNHRVEKVDSKGVLSVVAGTGAAAAPVPGPAKTSPLSSPRGVAVDASGALVIADTGNNQVEKVDAKGALSVFAGTGRPGASAAGPATAALLDGPRGVVVDVAGDVYVADTGNHRVLRITPAGALTVVAGTGTAGAPTAGPAASSALSSPSGLALDAAGALYVADTGNRRVEQIDPGGALAVIAGSGSAGAPAPGAATSSPLGGPTALAVDRDDRVLVADPAGRVVVRLSTTAAATTPHITSPAPPLAGVGVPYAHRFTATGVPAPRWSIIGAPPAGLVFTAATGVLAGTPTTKGTTTFTVRATSSVGHEDQVVALAVDAGPAAPTGVSAVAGDASATLTWTAPAIPAGSAAITGYVLTPHLAGVAGTPTTTTSTATTQTVTGLVNGSRYTFTVAAVTTVRGAASTPTTAAVMPRASARVPAGTTRLAGADRIATSVSASATLFPQARGAAAVVVSTSTQYADATTGARLASALRAPLLLTAPAALDPSVGAEITRVLADGGTIYVLGGEGAVSAGVAAALTALAPGSTVKRLSGEDRYATAVAIAAELDVLAPSKTAPVYLASGRDFPDGLAVSALAARTGGVVLLTQGDAMPTSTRVYLTAKDPAGVRTVPVGGPALGASARLAPAPAAAAAGAAIVGVDRYDTARLVAARFTADAAAGAGTTSGADAPVAVVGLATGENWPDALVGAAAMGNLGGPLLLTTGARLHPAAAEALVALGARTPLTRGVVLGSTGVVSEATATAFTARVGGK